MAFLFKKIPHFLTERKRRAKVLRELENEQNNPSAWKAPNYGLIEKESLPTPARHRYARLSEITSLPFERITPLLGSDHEVNFFANGTYYPGIHSLSYTHTSSQALIRERLERNLKTIEENRGIVDLPI